VETPGPRITPALFAEWRVPRFGTANPERLTNPVWEWLVRSELSAYAAAQQLGHGTGECREPGWSFARFGQSTTMLGDGRRIQIAGEHEDAYDRDFYIYNDVVVHHVDGSLEIFGYPRDVFPPTDFHSATIAGNDIVLVGSLGYPADRAPQLTQVAVLSLSTFVMTMIETSGEAPGWIHRHSATFLDGKNAIVISRGLIDAGAANHGQLRENGEDWRLDLTTWRWKRLTNRNWRQWQFTRVDRRQNHLWRLGSLSRFRGMRWAQEHRESMNAMVQGEIDALRAAYGADPDLDLFAQLYVPAVPHTALAAAEDELGARRIRVEGTTVRYVETPMSVRVVAEGALPESTATALLADLREKLSILEHTAYESREL
jgi:hypothetical protein